MNRLQKKCVIATAGIHLLLLLLLVFGSAFFNPQPKPDDTHLLDVISSNAIDTAFSSGVRNATPPPPAPAVTTPPPPVPLRPHQWFSPHRNHAPKPVVTPPNARRSGWKIFLHPKPKPARSSRFQKRPNPSRTKSKSTRNLSRAPRRRIPRTPSRSQLAGDKKCRRKSAEQSVVAHGSQPARRQHGGLRELRLRCQKRLRRGLDFAGYDSQRREHHRQSDRRQRRHGAFRPYHRTVW